MIDPKRWHDSLRFDPLPTLLGSNDEALAYFARRDLLGEPVPPVETLWELPEAARLARKQQPDGAWKYPGKTIDPETGENYFLIETYRNLRLLVERYGFTRAHPAIQRASDYVFSCQTAEGDIRSILGNQYMPYYHGAILELLIKAGYADDPRVLAGLEWLLTVRQDDGGWMVPGQQVPSWVKTRSFWKGETILPDRSLPHAHLATGMVLRAFAAHPAYRRRSEVIAAGVCLKKRIFQVDKYYDRKAASYWLKFQYPFWWANLVTALDTLIKLDFTKGEAEIARGLDWFLTNQEPDGLWPTGYGSGKFADRNRRWVGLAICRIIKAMASQS